MKRMKNYAWLLIMSSSWMSTWGWSSHTRRLSSRDLILQPLNSVKRTRDEMARNLNEPFRTTKSEDVQAQSVNDDELVPLVKCIAKAADMRKAEDIKAIRVSKLTTTTTFVMLCSGNSRPQNQAIAAAIKDEVEEVYEGKYALNGDGVPEGNADSGWILLDFGSVMVHVMTPRSRLFYDIEGKWKKGEDLNLDDVLLPNNLVGSGADGDSSSDEIDEDDPFWS